jgi:hypothetical protein
MPFGFVSLFALKAKRLARKIWEEGSAQDLKMQRLSYLKA